ncbi:unnamed protein product [Protopolystoma xenopodis]|uniref:Uncharacterized protein n=1 Tax=Protopolystoma xenopodis TaxID=117903 RepID=A0A3S4ZMW8_9PLAT|nr:unnamed protein product [Protopolystoma xenopodis]
MTGDVGGSGSGGDASGSNIPSLSGSFGALRRRKKDVVTRLLQASSSRKRHSLPSGILPSLLPQLIPLPTASWLIKSPLPVRYPLSASFFISGPSAGICELEFVAFIVVAAAAFNSYNTARGLAGNMRDLVYVLVGHELLITYFFSTII